MKRTALIIIAGLSLLLPQSARSDNADDAIIEPPQEFAANTYKPEYCQFSATFPEKPIITKKCEDESDEASCYNLISYNKVFGLSTAINVEIICNPATPEMYDYFTPEKMQDTIKAMTENTVIEAYDTSVQQDEDYRVAGLIGKARKGLEDTIYIAQLWVAKDSIMSIEAQMNGDPDPEADKLFAEILRGIGYTNQLSAQPQSAE